MLPKNLELHVCLKQVLRSCHCNERHGLEKVVSCYWAILNEMSHSGEKIYQHQNGSKTLGRVMDQWWIPESMCAMWCVCVCMCVLIVAAKPLQASDGNVWPPYLCGKWPPIPYCLLLSYTTKCLRYFAEFWTYSYVQLFDCCSYSPSSLNGGGNYYSVLVFQGSSLNHQWCFSTCCGFLEVIYLGPWEAI